MNKFSTLSMLLLFFGMAHAQVSFTPIPISTTVQSAPRLI